MQAIVILKEPPPLGAECSQGGGARPSSSYADFYIIHIGHLSHFYHRLFHPLSDFDRYMDRKYVFKAKTQFLYNNFI